MGYRSSYRFIILSVFIAVVLNVFRVALTGVLAHFVDPEMATGFFHEFTGMIVFIVGLFLLYGITGFAKSIIGSKATLLCPKRCGGSNKGENGV